MDDLDKILDEARAAGASVAQLEDLAASYKKKNPAGSTVSAGGGAQLSSPSSSGTQNDIPATIAAPQPSGPVSFSSAFTQGEQDLASPGTSKDFQGYQADPADNADDDTDNRTRNAVEGGGYPKGYVPPGEVSDDTPLSTPGYGPSHIAGAIDKAFAIIPKAGYGLFSLINAGNNLGKPDSEKAPSNIGMDVFSWAADYLTKLGDDAPLPNTFGGKVVGGVAQAVPVVLAMAAGDEAAPFQDASAAAVPTKLGMVQTALTKAAGPLTKYLAVTKTLENAGDAYKSSGGDLGATTMGAISGFNEGVESGVSLELQMAAGGQVGQTLFNQAVKAGIVKADGVLTEQALKSFVGSPAAFAVGSITSDLAAGKPIDWQNAGVSAATALPFEAPHVFEAYNQSSDIKANNNELNAAVNKAVAVRDNNAIVNFSQAQPEDIFHAMQLPETSQELQMQAIEKGMQAQDADDYKVKNSLHLQQLQLQQQADIKKLGEVVINQGVDGFVEAVNHTELPDELKTTLLNNAQAINAVYNPVELQKTDIGKNITDLDTQIQSLHQQPKEGVEPGVLSDNLVQLNDLMGQKVKAQSDLFNLSYQDNETQKAGVELANKILEQPVTEARPAEANENLPEQVTQKSSIPVNTEFLPDSKITDVNDNGDATIEHPDGSSDVVEAENLRGLGITDDHIQQFRDANDTTKRIPVPAPTPVNPDDAQEGESEFEHKLRTVTDPAELANMYHDKVTDLQTNFSPEGAIADYHGRVSADNFHEHNDRNNVTPAIARNYFTKKGEPSLGIDTQADEINGIYFNHANVVQPEDITDFMVKHPGGHNTYFTPAGNAELDAINTRYKELTGKNLRKDIARKLAEKYNVDNATAHAAADSVNSAKTNNVIEARVDELVHRSGLFEGLADPDALKYEFEKYVQDPSNDFNYWHQAFDGEKPNEHDIELVNRIIDERTNHHQGDSEGTAAQPITGSEDSAEKSGSQSDSESGDAAIKQGENGVKTEGNEAGEIGQLSANQSTDASTEKIDPETQEKLKTAMHNLFPGIEARYYDSLEEFDKAAVESGMITKSEKGITIHGFVDGDGIIHFNPEFTKKDTQLHEQGHILTNWAYHYAPKLYERIIDAGRIMGDVHQELARNGYRLKGNRLYEEAFVTALGKDAAGKLDEILKGPEQRSSLGRLIHEAWTKFERWVAGRTGFSLSRFKNIGDMSFDEFTKYINDKYLGSDVKVSDITSEELKAKNNDQGNQSSMSADKPVRQPGEALNDFAKRSAQWMDEQAAKVKETPAPENKPPVATTNTDEAKPSSDEPEVFTPDQKSANDVTAEPAPEENKGKPGYNVNETSIKNETTTEERRARFLDKVEVAAKRDFGQVFDRAKQMVIDGKIDPKVLAQNIIEDPRPLRAEESAALMYGRMQLYNDHKATLDNIEQASDSGNVAMETQERVRLAEIENSINENDIASRLAGYEQGLGLAARQMMIKDDYSLANQQQIYKVANAGKELPFDVQQKLESLTKELAAKTKELEDYQKGAKARELTKAFARIKKEAENENREAKAKKRENTIEQSQGKIKDIKNSIYEKLTRRNTQSNIGGPFGDAIVKLTEITPDLISLTKEYIKVGITTVDGIVDQLHNDIKDHIEGISKRDIRDAISGYGKTSKLSDDDTDIQLRELKRQSRLISALEDAQNGERPLRTGLEREQPSDKVRELQKQVYRAMIENGIPIDPKIIDPAEAWKSALDAVKTRLKNQITDLNKQLETGEKSAPRPSIKYDQEATDLKAERDKLQEAVDLIHGKSTMAPEHLIAIAKGTLERSIAEYERRIKEMDLNPKKPESNSPQSPELDALRERLSSLKETYQKLQDDAKPKISPEERALAAFKTRNEKKAAELQARIDNKQFEPNPQKEPIALDEEGKALQTRINALKRKIDQGREDLRMANRSKLEKRLDWAAKYRKFVLLVDPSTVGKLTSAGAMRSIISPIEELAGHGLSKIPGISKISAMAPREGGGLSIAAEARSLAETLTKRSINEMMRTAKEGKSALDERVNTDEPAHPANSFFDIPGQIHSALKTIPKQMEYYRSLQKRIEFALRNGYDITSPDVQTSMQVENFKNSFPELFNTKAQAVDMSVLEHQSYNDSKRAIFMQDNIIATKWQKMITATPKEGAYGQIIQFVGKVMIPIIKIPTNFVAETSSLVPGIGAMKGMIALRNGIEKLSPEEADYVMRAFKKQSVGLGFFALGYSLPKYIGGFYVKKEERGWQDPGPGDIMLFGESVPHWLMHSPVLEVMQMGATARRIHDQYMQDSEDNQSTDLVNGALGTTKGLFGQIPLFGEPADIVHGTEDANSWNKFSANFVLGLVEPYDVQRVAKFLDKDENGNPIERAPKTFTQNIEAAIPGLRKNVPEK